MWATPGAFRLPPSGCYCCPPLHVEVVPPKTNHLTSAVVCDTHCHVFRATDGPLPEAAVVVAVNETDWESVLNYCGRPSLIPGLGVHPWEAHLTRPGYLNRLRSKLAARDDAIIGEIGLCKCAKNVRGPAKARGWQAQLQVFNAQLQVARDLGRPVSIHCVRAFGDVRESLRRLAPPSAALHSFSGSAHQVREFLRLETPVFFGFSTTIGFRDDAIRAVPADRLLAESDAEDPVEATRATRAVVALIAEARGWSPAEAADRLTANSRAWLQFRRTATSPAAEEELAALTALYKLRASERASERRRLARC